MCEYDELMEEIVRLKRLMRETIENIREIKGILLEEDSDTGGKDENHKR